MDNGAVTRFDRRTMLGAGVSFLLSPGFSFAREMSSEPSIRFGLTPVFLTSDLELLGRLQAYLQRATGSPVDLITRRTYQEITTLLVSGQLDAAWICGYLTSRYSERREAAEKMEPPVDLTGIGVRKK